LNRKDLKSYINILFLFCIGAVQTSAQSTFVKIFHSGGNGTVSDFVLMDDHVFMKTGFLNPEHDFHGEMTFYKITRSGEIVDSLRLYNPELSYGRHSYATMVIDNHSLVTAQTYAGPATIMWKLNADLEIVDSVIVEPVDLAQHPDASQYINRAAVTDGSNVFITCKMFLPDGSERVDLLKYNSDLELVFSVENEFLRFFIAPMMHYAFESQMIIVSVAKIVTSGYDNELLVYTESGELVNTIPIPTHAFSILSKENKIYYGTSDANGVNTFQAKLIIIDLEGNPIAETEIEDHFWPEYNTSAVYNLTSTCDGGLVGTTDLQKMYWVDGEPDYSHENDLGLLKFDELGNMLWSRYYRFLNTERYYHYIYKIVEDDDGSLYLGGELRNEDYNHPEYVYPSQRHWFMKLDVCGCLIPGCDPNCNYSGCSTINPATLSASDYFNIGPNPTSDVLSVYLKDNPDLEGAQLSIFNAAGQLVEQYKCEESNITYILDCSNYAAGSYTMTLNAGQTMLQTEKVQIIR
jgi:hypothetical protein